MVGAALLLDTSTTVEAAALETHRVSVSKMVQFREQHPMIVSFYGLASSCMYI